MAARATPLDCQLDDVLHRMLERPCAKDDTCICGILPVGNPVLRAITLTGSDTAKPVGR